MHLMTFICISAHFLDSRPDTVGGPAVACVLVSVLVAIMAELLSVV
jgi:hypothetical protein